MNMESNEKTSWRGGKKLQGPLLDLSRWLQTIEWTQFPSELIDSTVVWALFRRGDVGRHCRHVKNAKDQEQRRNRVVVLRSTTEEPSYEPDFAAPTWEKSLIFATQRIKSGELNADGSITSWRDNTTNGRKGNWSGSRVLMGTSNKGGAIRSPHNKELCEFPRTIFN